MRHFDGESMDAIRSMADVSAAYFQALLRADVSPPEALMLTINFQRDLLGLYAPKAEAKEDDEAD